MGLKERFYDRLGFIRANTIEDMKNNETLVENNIVKVAETGYFYDIKTTGSIQLNNGLFAEIKQNTFLQLVTDNINKLTQHISTMATPSQNGHMSSTDKAKLDGVANNANNYSLPTASTTVLGGIKIGKNLSIAGDGTLNVGDNIVQTDRRSFRVHADGFKEAWGSVTLFNDENYRTINLPVTFSNLNYNLSFSFDMPDPFIDSTGNAKVTGVNTISYRTNWTTTGGGGGSMRWYVCGY